MDRRNFLSLLGTGALATAAAPLGFLRQRSGGRSGTSGAAAFVPDVELELTAAPGAVPILPGRATQVWRYTAALRKGPPNTLQTVADSFLGPTIRLQTGQKVRIHFVNQLPEGTILHMHGLHVPEAMDGHPRFMVANGQRYVYEFEVVNRAGTYWYHPHHHTRTGPQVYAGLAGFLLVSDPAEAALGLPAAAEEIPCVLQDRAFDSNNQLSYASGMPMEPMNGFLGNRVLVNGRVDSTMSLATRAYRLRLLNGSNSRVYKLAWNDGTPMTVIGTDGGLLERPLTRPYVMLVPGERSDVVLDLSHKAVGTELELRSLAFSSAPFEMAMGMGRGGRAMGRGGAQRAEPNGAPLSILTIRVDRRETSSFSLPQALSTFDASWQPGAAARPARVMNVQFAMMRWLLNGRAFDMNGVAPNETVTLGSKEIWEFDNAAASMMGMRLAHPLHLHGRQFRVLSRRMDPAWTEAWDSMREGVIDEGWKDTFLLMPGERAQILVHFTRYPGTFLYHCHNLEHEDMGMMRNYRVVG